MMEAERADELLTPQQVCERMNARIQGWRMTPDLLAQWRHQKRGPAFHKIGARVFYETKDVIEWEQATKTNPAK